MSREKIECYQRWFKYECDAHAKVVSSLGSVPAERRSGVEYRRALSILAHIVAARRTWLGRIGVTPPFQGKLFPDNPNLEQIAKDLHEAEGLWTKYLSELTDQDVDRFFEYQSLDAGRFRNRIEDILTQLFGHSWYHRGQIAMLVRLAGGQPAATDLVYWCREPVSGR